MDEKEKYRAQIEARLMKFGESMYEITNKMEQRKENLPDFQIDDVLRKQEDAEAKLKQLDQSDDSSWQKFKSDLDQLTDDIDEDLRKALAYFN
jgi:heterodisulfide reductase subunit C